jgi:cupin domain
MASTDGLVEEYEVIEGSFDVMLDGDWRTLGPGESASVPEGTLHTFKNRSGDVVRVHNVHRPAARFEDYIEHIHRLMQARGITKAKDPRIPVYLSDAPVPGDARPRSGARTNHAEHTRRPRPPAPLPDRSVGNGVSRTTFEPSISQATPWSERDPRRVTTA